MMISGGLVAAGAVLVVAGLRPHRPALATVIATMAQPRPVSLSGSRRVDLALSGPLGRLGLPRRRTRQDLAIVDRDPAQYLAQTVVVGVVGLVGVGLLPLLVGLGGQAPLWAGLLGAGVAVKAAQARVHSEAQRRRVQMRATLSAMLDLVGGSLAGGAGIEQALDETLDELTGWAAVRIRRELHSAAQTRGPQRVHAWTALRDLSRNIGVDELGELAAGIEQASGGAPVADTVAQIARAIRSRAVSTMERDGRSRSARMAIPIMIFGFGYLILLLYGALSTIGAGFAH
jgi:Flp pilus assembly protein TadB